MHRNSDIAKSLQILTEGDSKNPGSVMNEPYSTFKDLEQVQGKEKTKSVKSPLLGKKIEKSDEPNLGRIVSESAEGTKHWMKHPHKFEPSKEFKHNCKHCQEAKNKPWHKFTKSVKESEQNNKSILKEDYCIYCDKKLPSNWDSDLCKKCLKKEEEKKKIKESTLPKCHGMGAPHCIDQETFDEYQDGIYDKNGNGPFCKNCADKFGRNERIELGKDKAMRNWSESKNTLNQKEQKLLSEIRSVAPLAVLREGTLNSMPGTYWVKDSPNGTPLSKSKKSAFEALKEAKENLLLEFDHKFVPAKEGDAGPSICPVCKGPRCVECGACHDNNCIDTSKKTVKESYDYDREVDDAWDRYKYSPEYDEYRKKRDQREDIQELINAWKENERHAIESGSERAATECRKKIGELKAKLELLAESKLRPSDSKVFKVLRYLTTTNIDLDDLKDFRYYLHSPVRLCLIEPERLGIPEAWFKNGKENLISTGFKTVQELAAWLEKHGVKQMKKPKPYKSTPSYYD